MWRVINIERQFAFYGAYRKSWFNILIHVLFVWPMIYGIMALLAYSEPLFPRPAWLELKVPHEVVQHMNFNRSFVAAVFYSIFYICLDNRAGFLAALLVAGCWLGGNRFAKEVPWETAWKTVLTGQLVCCTAQFLGSGPYEIGHPNVLENIVQTLLMAPYFVLLELLHGFGYVPYRGFFTRVQGLTQPHPGGPHNPKIPPPAPPPCPYHDTDCSSSDSDNSRKCCDASTGCDASTECDGAACPKDWFPASN